MLTSSFIDESSSITDLRENPLMLSLLCNLYRGARSIPRDRADLYERCATMLFDRWDSQRGIVVQGPLRSDAREALQDIALWIFQEPSLADGLPHKRLLKRLTGFYYPNKYENRLRAEEVAGELLALWRGRAWVLTDNGTSPSGETLYGFTHQTFLEYFAAIELARKNPSPRKLWTVLSRRIARAEWDIVAQVAIQSLNKSYRDGANIIIAKLLESATVTDRIVERLNLLSFASRYLDALALSAKRCREVTRACVNLALEGQPAFPHMPDLDAYSNRIVYYDAESELKLVPDDLLAPLLQTLNAPDEIGAYSRNEFAVHLRALMETSDPTTRGMTLILGLNYDRVLLIAEHIASDAGLFTDTNANAVNSLQIDCHLICRILSSAGHTNFWVPLEAARRGCIGTGNAVKYGGVDILYCAYSSFEHNALEQDPQSTLAFDLLDSIISASDTRELPATVMESLSEIAVEFRERLTNRSEPIDSSWTTTESGLAGRVVQRAFVREEPEEYLYEESLVHPLDAKSVAADPRRLAESSQPHILAWDSLFGAACLMAVVVEIENWTLYDYSEDQLGNLRLGLLQPMAPVFVSRLSRSFYFEVDEALQALPLGSQDAELLGLWARHHVRFAH